MDTPPPSITEMEIDDTEATFSPFTFQEIKTFDQPWFEILDMDEFNSIVTDKSETPLWVTFRNIILIPLQRIVLTRE